MRTPGAEVVRGRWRRSVVGRSSMEPLEVGGVAVLVRCMASGPAGETTRLERPISGGFADPGESRTGRLTINCPVSMVLQDLALV
jgi:hypothetical protein